MRPDDGPESRVPVDTFVTRAPSPATARAMIPSDDSIAAYQEAAAQAAGPSGVGVEEFERGLVEQGLMNPDALRTFREAMPPGAGPDGSGALARALVREGKLTRYQAAALYQGKARSLTIGPYVVLDKLGSGGMGMVFKARRREGGPEVALKLLPPSSSKQVLAVQRFRREAEIMARLDHPNIVASRELGEYGGVHYLVMDYVEGRDLDKVVRSGGPMKVPRAVDAAIQAARGLQAAHERGIVHRDIKPANLLLDARGVVRVLDLGLARVTHADDPLQAAGDGPSLTRSGVIMGTVDFLPPEQSDDSKRVDHRADIYSLGCTLHFLLAARPPFSGESIMQRLIAHHQKPVPSLRAARPEVPAELDELFARMLAKAPEDRPASMDEVIAGLERARAAAAPARGLQVFDDAPAPRSSSGSAIQTAPPVPEALDLLTFVRSELLATGEDHSAEAGRVATPLPPRSFRSGRRRWAVAVALGVGAVALASLGVVVGIVASLALIERARPPTNPPAKAPRRPEVVVAGPETARPAQVAEHPTPSSTVVPRPTGESTPLPAPADPPPAPREGPGLQDLLRALARPPAPVGPGPPLRPGDPGFGPVGPPLRPGDPGFGPPRGPNDRPRRPRPGG